MFQNGDGEIIIAGQTYGLRLTIGGLAELNSRLSVKGPQELSSRLRDLTTADGRALLACMMRPCLPSGDVSAPAANFSSFSSAQIADVMPIICELFEAVFLSE